MSSKQVSDRDRLVVKVVVVSGRRSPHPPSLVDTTATIKVGQTAIIGRTHITGRYYWLPPDEHFLAREGGNLTIFDRCYVHLIEFAFILCPVVN